MAKGNGVKTKLDIRDLQNDIKTIKENDLVHLKEDMKDLKNDVKNLSQKTEDIKDELRIFIVKVVAIATFAWAIIGLVALVIGGYLHK